METLEPQHKLLVIKTQPHILKGRKTLYHSVRWAWRINADRSSKADYDIQKLYVGKLLPNAQRGGQYPIRYINC